MNYKPLVNLVALWVGISALFVILGGGLNPPPPPEGQASVCELIALTDKGEVVEVVFVNDGDPIVGSVELKSAQISFRIDNESPPMVSFAGKDVEVSLHKFHLDEYLRTGCLDIALPLTN